MNGGSNKHGEMKDKPYASTLSATFAIKTGVLPTKKKRLVVLKKSSFSTKAFQPECDMSAHAPPFPFLIR
jgi:hypothetical protein